MNKKMDMKLLVKFVVVLYLLSMSYVLNAQDLTVTAAQKITNGNLMYIGTEFYVLQNAKIIAVKGDKVSFTLQIGNKNFYHFDFKDGKYTPAFDSVIIEPNVYKLYPFLPDDKDSVKITLELEYLE